jgi:type II secretion system protein H
MVDIRRGFTIIELLVVIALIGILAAVGIPGLRSYGRSNNLRAAAEQITGDLWYARQKAIATSRPFSVLFDTENNRYLVFRDDGGANPGAAANGVLDSGEVVFKTRQLDQTVFLTEVDLDPDNSVVYVPQGTLRSGTAGGSITVSDGGTRARTVTVMAGGLWRSN